MWLPPKILPVVGINTLSFVMLNSQRTPLGLKVIHVEGGIVGHLMDQPRFYILICMSKAAKIRVFTVLRHFFRAVFSLVSLYVI